MNKPAVVIRLDIFKDIGFGHLARIKRLVEFDFSRDYILLYRTDLKNVKSLFGNSFKGTFEIGDNSNNKNFNKLDNINSQYKEVQLSDWKNTKLIIDAIRFNHKIYMLIVDNFLINNFWLEELRTDSLWRNLKIVYIDDCNRNYNNVDLNIIYNKDENKLIERGNRIIAEGLFYCPFSVDLVKERERRLNNKLLNKSIDNFLLSFGLFDEFNYCDQFLEQFYEQFTNSKIIILIAKESNSFESVFRKYNLKKNIKIINYISNVIEIYKFIYFGIGNFGLMSLEKAYLGIPQVNLVESENQINTSKILTKKQLSKKVCKIQELNKFNFDEFQSQFDKINKNLLDKGMGLFGKGIIEWLVLIDKISG